MHIKIDKLFNKIKVICKDPSVNFKFAVGDNHHQCKCRGLQAEMLMGYIAKLANYTFNLAQSRQIAHDCIISGLKIQVKQRTLRSHGFYSISNLRPQNYNAGEVDAFVVFETHNNQQLKRIILAKADNVFKHPKLYFSNYNKSWQLTNKRFEAIADSIITLA